MKKRLTVAITGQSGCGKSTLSAFYASKGYKVIDCDKVAKDIAERIGFKVAIVDVNDLAGTILGTSEKAMNRELLVRILKDNPLGQSAQQTPMGIIREVKNA